MSAKNYIALSGVILVIIGGMCPMLRIPIIGTWNYWAIDTVLASLVYTFAAIALLAAVTQKQGLLRFCGWVLMLVLLFTLGAVYFKANNYFDFIPMKKLAAAASRMIRFQWIGWGLMFGGTFLIILFSGEKKPLVQSADTPDMEAAKSSAESQDNAL